MSRIKYTDLYGIYADKFDCPLTHKEFNKFIAEVLKTFTLMILEGKVVKIPYLGTFVITRITPRIIEEEGIKRIATPINYWKTMQERRKIQPDWEWKDWEQVPIHQRPTYYFDNELTDGDILKVRWFRKNLGTKCPYLKTYQFKLSKAKGRGKIREYLINGTKYLKDEQIYAYKRDIRAREQEAAAELRSQQIGSSRVDVGSYEEDGGFVESNAQHVQFYTDSELQSYYPELFGGDNDSELVSEVLWE